MTKLENREVAIANQALSMGMHDMAARTLSAVYRAGSKKTQKEILELAAQWEVIGHAEFII
jgi:hypothetical protein